MRVNTHSGIAMQWVFALPMLLLVLQNVFADEATCSVGSQPGTCTTSLPENATATIPAVASIKEATTTFPAVASMEGGRADIISQEISELKTMIKSCEDRVVLLEELKAMVTSGDDVAGISTETFHEPLPILSEVSKAPEKIPVASAGDYLLSKAIMQQSDIVNFVKFLPLRNPRTSGSTSTTQVPLPSVLLVAMQADGNANLFLPTGGNPVHTFATGHVYPVTNLATSMSHDEYFVATADEAGFIRVHRVMVRQKRIMKEQKQGWRNKSDDMRSQYLASQLNITAQFIKEMQVPASSDGEPPKVTALAVAANQGNKYFLAGDSEGQISVFTRNGTLQVQIDALHDQNLKIDAIQAMLSSLIFRSGVDWGFINLDKLDVTLIECPKFRGHVTSVISDSQQTSRVLVADQDGTVWVFNVRNKKDCKVEHRFVVGSTTAPIELNSIRGFVLGLEQHPGVHQPASLVALNMSHVGKRKEALAQEPSPVVWRVGREAVRDWAVHKRHQQGDLLAFLSEDGLEIEIMELLMQVYQEPAGDSFGNFKMPVIAVAIVLVLGYQYMKQKGKFGRIGGGGSGLGSKKFDWDGFDTLGLKNRKKPNYKGAGLIGRGRS